ncbi:MAG: DNA-directed RNA polymerase subunit D [Aigarchaeota archaeon]|nr:DNA-directed RNA polymerase subunit D [Aigarchaeota archaeon]MDW8092441.1 DNA-directed RNA polymerase subunit D [Nitrososphaerota archaeon]
MELRILEEQNNWIKLAFTGLPLAVYNAIRRAILTEVPVMAVEEVLVIDNSSPIMNEVLAYRISLVPFVTDLDNYLLPEECDCKSRLGCSKCSVRFSLKVEANSEPLTVYSRDIKPEGNVGIIRPTSDSFPIVKLAPGQRVELELYVRLGKGSRHPKWQPGIVTVYDDEKNGLVLYVESFGFLPPRRMVTEAVKRLRGRVIELKRKFEEATSQGVLNEAQS